MGQLDFSYQISDERLIAYHRLSLLDRLKWLDDLRRFTLAVRAAPDVARVKECTNGKQAEKGIRPSPGRTPSAQ